MSVLKAVVFTKITTDKSPLEMNAFLELTCFEFNRYQESFRILNALKMHLLFKVEQLS